MKIVVIGAGAMGALFGAKLSASGHDVTLVDIWHDHVNAMMDSGLIIEESDGSVGRYDVHAVDRLPEDIGDADLILVEVKSYDTVAALQPLRDRLGTGTVVLSLQNGIGNYEQMKEALPEHDRLMIGTTAHGSNVEGSGHIRRTGEGPTEIGDPVRRPDYQDELEAIARAFTGAGIEMTVADNIHAAVWAKLAANASINPLTALTGLRNGELPGDPGLVSVYTAIVNELTQVMDALGIPRIKDDYVAYAEFVMEVTSQSYSSMLQDVRFRRRTEIDAVNGAVARFGREVGVATPVNEMIASLVRNRQRDYLEEGRGAF